MLTVAFQGIYSEMFSDIYIYIYRYIVVYIYVCIYCKPPGSRCSCQSKCNEITQLGKTLMKLLPKFPQLTAVSPTEVAAMLNVFPTANDVSEIQ